MASTRRPNRRCLMPIELFAGRVWSLSARCLPSGVSSRRSISPSAGIASIGSVERVLQVIVDRVRELVGAEYAALGHRRAIRAHRAVHHQRHLPTSCARCSVQPPRGHGMLGLIIREDRSLADRRHRHRSAALRLSAAPSGDALVPGRAGAQQGPFDRQPVPDQQDRRRRASPTRTCELVERFALHAGIAIENARLHEEIGRLAIVEERQRISQDLHDSIIQSLYAISLSLEDLPEVIAEDPAEGAARADRAIDSIHATIRDIRNFIMGLQPELLANADLADGHPDARRASSRRTR